MASGGFTFDDGDGPTPEDDGTFFPVLPFFTDEGGIAEPRPPAFVGGDVGLEAVIARSASAAVVLRDVWARPDGFGFRLVSHTREHRNIHGGPWGPDPNESLRVGLVHPDGAKVLTDHERGFLAGPDAHGLQPAGGGGDGWRYELEYRAWPLPGPGALTFVVRWRAEGIEDVTYVLDAERLIEAAARARPLWD